MNENSRKGAVTNRNHYHLSPTPFIVFHSRFQVPTLIIHDKNDREVDWSNGNHVARMWPWAKFISTTGLGHRRILINQEVIEMVSEFVVEKQKETKGSS